MSHEAELFYAACLEENFVTQHVDFMTRNDAILDLLITDKPYIIYNLEEVGNLAASGHKSLTWKVAINKAINNTAKIGYEYYKAAIYSVRTPLQKWSWK